MKPYYEHIYIDMHSGNFVFLDDIDWYDGTVLYSMFSGLNRTTHHKTTIDYFVNSGQFKEIFKHG